MRILLSDGSGLTSRQCATLLGRAGHEVEVLGVRGVPLTRWTRHVRRVHRLPAYGTDPLGWWEQALRVVDQARPDVLLPTQEQTAVISLRGAELERFGTRSVVPPFGALAQVQDKLSADRRLREAGLPRPPSWVASSPRALVEGIDGPAFLKGPIGTASTAVRRVAGRREAAEAAHAFARAGAFQDGGVLVEAPVAGVLVMVQSIFDRGRLIRLHACERSREGAGGGASAKTSRQVPGLADQVAAFGERLGWHGALSLDAIESADGLVWIDVNPRIVEPVNAALAGVDLLGALLDLARGSPGPPPVLAGRPGIRTHQLLLGVLGAAQAGEGRRGVGRELVQAAARQGPYANSVEELTPVHGDPIAALPVIAATAACLIRPRWERAFSASAVTNYALTPAGWRTLQAAADAATTR